MALVTEQTSAKAAHPLVTVVTIYGARQNSYSSPYPTVVKIPFKNFRICNVTWITIRI